VEPGDTLGNLAIRFYDDQSEWRRIYEANIQTIGEDPDQLTVGMVLRIPPKQ
jgi:nucleoid-associated protein YgaU